MKAISIAMCGFALLATALANPAMAAGPVDGEFGAFWWANDYEGGSAPSTDAGAPGFRAALWLKERYGVKASQFTSDLDDLGAPSSDYLSLDLMWRAFAPTEHNFVAVGLGWEQMDMSNTEDTSGMRVSVEGHVGIMGQVQAYGEGSYLPSLDDTPTLEEMSGLEYEVGVAWRAAPFVSVKAGYRGTDVDYEATGVGGNAQSTGFLLGLGLHF